MLSPEGSKAPLPTPLFWWRSRLRVALPALLFILGGASYSSKALAAATYMLAYPAAPYDVASSVYALKADATNVPVTDFFGTRYSYGHLAFEGTTTFVLTVKSGQAITGFNISPHTRGITGTVNGANLTFSVAQGQSAYLIVTVTTSSGTLRPMVIAGDAKEIGAPAVGGNVFDITAPPYSADKTGTALLNSKIQSAINTISANGGGTVYFPAGVYLISNGIQMASNVTVYLAGGAFLHGSSNRADYSWGTDLDASGNPTGGAQNFQVPGGVNNVTFAGRGVLDANSTVLVSPEKPGGPIDGWGGYRKGIIKTDVKNGGIRPNGVTISGITVKDATGWTLNMEDAQNVTIRGVKLLNDFTWVHSDGFDLVSVDNGKVENCLGVSGDDVYDVKASTNNAANNITYNNNVAFSYLGTGTKIGMQAKATATNIVFSNIEVVAGQRAVSVSHDQGAGSWSGIHFNDIHMETIQGTATTGQFQVAPIVIWTLGSDAGPVTNVSLSRVTIENSRGFKSQISGATANGRISDVTLQDVVIDGSEMTASNYTSKIAVGSNVNGLNFGLVSGALYTLASKYNSLALDNGNVTACNTPVIQWPMNYPSTASQQWQLTSVGTNIYTLVSQKSTCAMDNSSSHTSGAGIIQWGLNNQIQQKWTITSVGNGLYKMLSTESGLALDDNHVAPGTMSTSSQVVQYTVNGGATQQWKLTKQ